MTYSLNDSVSTLTITSEAGTTSGNTRITVSEALSDGNSYKYKIATNPTIPSIGDTCSAGYTNWNGIDEIKADTGKIIVIVEVDAENKAVKVGTTEIVSKQA